MLTLNFPQNVEVLAPSPPATLFVKFDSVAYSVADGIRGCRNKIFTFRRNSSKCKGGSRSIRITDDNLQILEQI